METFGNKYRITFDEAYTTFHIPRKCLDPWYMQIPCKKGTIYPYGNNKLALEINRRASIVKTLLELGIKATQWGDYEKTLVFDIELFPEVAKLVLPKEKRKMTPERLAWLKEHGKKLGLARKNRNGMLSA